jgi:hypothetical protein
MDTPDFAGILCVILYNDKNLNINSLKIDVNNYIKNMDINNPHCIRWAISLSYVMGILENKKGWFYKCVGYDFTKFSSLIFNKQLMAYEKIAIIEIEEGNINKAKCTLEFAIEEFKKALKFNLNKTIGKNGTYIYFSAVELAELCDKASQLIKFLQNIDSIKTNKDLDNLLDSSKRFGCLPYIISLENRIKELEC